MGCLGFSSRTKGHQRLSFDDEKSQQHEPIVRPGQESVPDPQAATQFAPAMAETTGTVGSAVALSELVVKGINVAISMRRAPEDMKFLRVSIIKHSFSIKYNKKKGGADS